MLTSMIVSLSFSPLSLYLGRLRRSLMMARQSDMANYSVWELSIFIFIGMLGGLVGDGAQARDDCGAADAATPAACPLTRLLLRRRAQM